MRRFFFLEIVICRNEKKSRKSVTADKPTNTLNQISHYKSTPNHLSFQEFVSTSKESRNILFFIRLHFVQQATRTCTACYLLFVANISGYSISRTVFVRLSSSKSEHVIQTWNIKLAVQSQFVRISLWAQWPYNLLTFRFYSSFSTYYPFSVYQAYSLWK